MDYKSLMGYGNKKKVTKKQSKSKTNEVLKSLQEEFGEINENPALARVGMAVAQAAGQGFGQSVGDKVSDKLMSQKDDDEEEELEEGPAFEYKKHAKNIDKSLKGLQKSYLDFYEVLRKKGLDDEASNFLDNYKKNIVDFTKKYKKDFRKLM
jgi:hypothetical protein